jgi:signal transduction histidine kinase
MRGETFKHRSGRVISLGRLVLAAVFLIGLWLDPSQPSRAPEAGYAVLGAYLALAALLLASTWNNWWRESRLAAPAHVLDIIIFSVMVFLTEGYTSPFFTFFVFLLLSATIRWGWRETALTAVFVVALFFTAGILALQFGEAEFDLQRLIFRSAYLVVLSLILIWFGLSQSAKSTHMRRMGMEESAQPAQLPIEHALRYALARTGGERAMFAWWEHEEPWTNVSALEADELVTRRFAPGDLDNLVNPALADSPFIFDRLGGRVISGPPARGRRLQNSLNEELMSELQVEEGLAIPIESEEFGGLLIVSGVPGLCSDDLGVADRIGKEVSAELRRAALLRVSEESAVVRTRLSLARDLHDSVVQLLAGTSFRLEAIRKAAGAGRDIDSDVTALQSELAQEQRELRRFIMKLRGDAAVGGEAELQGGLAALAERMSRQWGIECTIVSDKERVHVPSRLEHDLHQLVREGVANAVRHGGANKVELSLSSDGSAIHLQISDNGSGFPLAATAEDGEKLAEAVGPWSLRERVRALGGKLRLTTRPSGSRIAMTLPVELRH